VHLRLCDRGMHGEARGRGDLVADRWGPSVVGPPKINVGWSGDEPRGVGTRGVCENRQFGRVFQTL
jgi:hypothetical protein